MDQHYSKPLQNMEQTRIQFVKIKNNRVNIRYSNQQTTHVTNPTICKELLERSLENYRELIGNIKCDLPVNQDIFEPRRTYKVFWQSELTFEKVEEMGGNLSEELDKQLKSTPGLFEDKCKLHQRGNDTVTNYSNDPVLNDELPGKTCENGTEKISQLKLSGNILRKRKMGRCKLNEPLIDETIDVNTEGEEHLNPGGIPRILSLDNPTEVSQKLVKSTFFPPRHVPSLAEQLNYNPEITSVNRLKRFHETQKDSESSNTASQDLNHTNTKPVKKYEEYLDPKERPKRVKVNCYRNRLRRQKYESESSEDEKPVPFPSATDSLFVSSRKIPLSKQQNTSDDNQITHKPGGARFGINNKFVPPIYRNELQENVQPSKITDVKQKQEYLKVKDPKLVEMIMSEIVDNGPPVYWDDIAGLEFAKATIKEIVVWPMLRPDIFTGLRGPPKGLLLFGPPGTGKTLIGKCIASQAGATFFSISASSITSKWVGEGEKLVCTLFTVAKQHQPAVIFIDEIDSLLTQRSDNEHESSRRIKTEFLIQLDGATTQSEERILVVGATNRPQEIDEAARRRLSKRLYIPLPNEMARGVIISKLMVEQSHSLTEQDVASVVEKTGGFSGADMANLCREAALGPIRSLDVSDIFKVSKEQVRPINREDFINSLSLVKPSVSEKDLEVYIQWNKTFGSTNVASTV